VSNSRLGILTQGCKPATGLNHHDPDGDAMWYWNQDNFEGLAAVAASIAEDVPWRGFAEYLRLRDRGLRKQSLAAIAQLIEDAARWSTVDRRRFADWIYDTQLRLPDVHQLIVTPLKQQLLIPTLQEWADSEPANHIPRRWLGFATADHDHFVAALSLCPWDDISRYRLVVRDLGCVDFQCHHLPDFFIGDPHDAISTLNGARELLRGFIDSAIAPPLERDLADLYARVSDWLAFQATDPSASFATWCFENGRDYHWVRAYYYRR